MVIGAVMQYFLSRISATHSQNLADNGPSILIRV